MDSEAGTSQVWEQRKIYCRAMQEERDGSFSKDLNFPKGLREEFLRHIVLHTNPTLNSLTLMFYKFEQ